MTTRRGFLGSLLAISGGIAVGDEVLDAFLRLTHQRKSFPSAWIPRGDSYGAIAPGSRVTYHEVWEKMPSGLWSYRVETPNTTVHYPDGPAPFTEVPGTTIVRKTMQRDADRDRLIGYFSAATIPRRSLIR